MLDPQTGKQLEYRQLLNHPDKKLREAWIKAFCYELGRLAQGFQNKVKYCDAIDFITYTEIPANKVPAYARLVAEVRPQKKDEPNRLRMTVGGDRIHYPFDKSQPTADLSTIKLHLNSTISTPNARYACIDIKNMYLMLQN